MPSAPKSFGSQLQFNKIPVLGLVPESSVTGSAPASPVNGQLWFDTTLGRLYIREAGGWVLASQTGAELTSRKDQANGYAGLDGSSKIAIGQVPTGQTGSTVPFGNDARFSDNRTPTDDSVTGGTAGAGVKIKANTITDANVAAANKSGAAGVESLRQIGTGALQAMAGNTRLDTIAAPTGSVSLNNQLITNLLTPVSGTDAVNKNYADGLRAGLRIKDAVVAATTTDITLSNTQTIDTVALTAGQRVLVKDQSTASQNGIYVVVSGGAWTRDTDADTFGELQDGATVFVQQGGQANTTWAQVNTLTALTDAQSWVQQGAAASYVPGSGLSQSGQTFNVGGTADRIAVTADNVDIASTYAGQTSITTVGTITTGTWNGTDIAVAAGGTGADTAAGARSNLGATGKSAGVVAQLVAGTETVYTHNLGSQDVTAQFFDATTRYEVDLSWRQIDANTIGITADIAYAASAIRAVVIG